MNALIIPIFCLAFIVGAFASALPDWVGGATAFGSGIGIGLAVPLLWRHGPKRWVWFVAGLIACLASFYVQFRTPQPQPNDISKFAPATEITVKGEVIEPPAMTRSGRAKFILDVSELKLGSGKIESVSGNVYTTISLTEATGLRPGQRVEISGTLYKPKGADNPGAFDFQLYLSRLGVFAGLSGRQLTLQGDPPVWGWWSIRSRMVKAHVTGAGIPEGALLSSLVLGNRAVDLPPDLKDTFIEVGLAAALAASGFQVSLILGAVLLLNRNSPPLHQFMLGTASLLGFLILTGVSPSVLRAVVMGMGTLIALVTQRRSRPLAGLTLAAVILLAYQPLWIWDLGFQFSFLATLGLVVTVEPLTKRLEWLPPAIAVTVAVPIAAFVWTLPLQLFVFGKLSIYSILANVLTTPLISVTTIGGLIGGLLGVVFVPLGALASWLLLVPLKLIIAIANWIHTLPGAVTNSGTIALWQLLASYAILLSIWLRPKWHRFWFLAIVTAMAIVFIPTAIVRSNAFQATVLSTGRVPVMLLEDRGKTTLINSGDKQTAIFTLRPFLEKQGINRIDLAIATDQQPDVSDGWDKIPGNSIAIAEFRDFDAGVASKSYQELTQVLAKSGTNVSTSSVGQPVQKDPEVQLELVNQKPKVLRLRTANTTWLLLTEADDKAQEQLLDGINVREPDPNNPPPPENTEQPPAKKQPLDLKAEILWWTGEDLRPDLIDVIKPKIAIASSTVVSNATIAKLKDAKIRLYWTGRDGAIQWTAENEIQTVRDREDANSPI